MPGSTAPEKQIIVRGLILKPSRTFKWPVSPHTAPVNAGEHGVAGRLTWRPVFCVDAELVRRSEGKGPVVIEFDWKRTVVPPAISVEILNVIARKNFIGLAYLSMANQVSHRE